MQERKEMGLPQHFSPEHSEKRGRVAAPFLNNLKEIYTNLKKKKIASISLQFQTNFAVVVRLAILRF